MLVALVVVVVSMSARDFLGTLLVVAEATGRDRLAGAMDAAGDVANMACTVVGVDALNAGIDAHSLTVLAVMCATSYQVTTRTTRWARRLRPDTTPPT